MKFKEILASIKKGEFKPIYFLHGEEPFFIDQIAEAIEQYALPEEQKSFNLSVFYGKDTDARTVRDAAQRFPMMAERQVVILKEAQEMQSLGELKGYFEHPVPTTVLLIAHKHKRLRMNTSLGKAIKAAGKEVLLFEAKPLYDNQLPGWIAGYLKDLGFTIDPDAAALVAESLGADLGKVANELDKLALNQDKGSRITAEHIETHIGISKDFNVFELQSALGARDLLKANRIVRYFEANPRKNPIQMVIANLYGFFSKLLLFHHYRAAGASDLAKKLKVHPYFLKDYQRAARSFSYAQAEHAIALLCEYDLKSKGVGYQTSGKPGGELLSEMVWRILHSE